MGVKKTSIPALDKSKHRRKRPRRGRKKRKERLDNFANTSKGVYRPRRKFSPRKNDYESAAKQDRTVVLIDSDEFYGLTLDMVLYNFGISSSIQIFSADELSKFLQHLGDGKFKNLVVLIDPNTKFVQKDLNRLIEMCKKNSQECKLVEYSPEKEKADAESYGEYDYFVLKTARANENTIIKTLSDILGQEFVMDNSDPEGAYI